jgi:hypothetical protein
MGGKESKSIDVEFIDCLKEIIKEKYDQKRDQVFDEFVKKLETIDIKTRLLECVNEGFAGFTYFKNPYIEALTKVFNCSLNSIKIYKSVKKSTKFFNLKK